MIKILKKTNNLEFLAAYLKIEKEICWSGSGHKGKQTGLQYRLNEDPWSSAVGRAREHEYEFDLLNPFFKNTIFESFILEHSLVRTRLMWSGPYSCYSMHRDNFPRIHLPIITNIKCYFLFKDSVPQHMPVNNVYWVDTTKPHTFINCSEHHRLHLVGIPKN